MEWTTALPDWEKRIVNRQSLIPCKPLFPDEAERALTIFKSLVMVDVIGKPTFGEVCAQWVFDFVASVFGAYDPITKKQLINDFFLLISKKNGKSTIAAGIMITALLLNDRYSAELLILAPTKEVADNAYKPASDIVRETMGLSQILVAKDHIKEIRHLETKSILKVVAADNETVSGKKASFVLVDELWLFGKKPKADNMLKEATGGLVSRPEGFVIYLSTHSDEPPAGVFKKKLDYFRDVRDGKIVNKGSLGVLYEFPQKMIDNADYLNPDNYYITNPNIGKSVTSEWIKVQYDKENDEGGRRVFLAKHLNVEIGQNLRGNRWVGADFWESHSDTRLCLDSLLERSEVAVVGIDGGGADDLTGLSVIGREKITGHWLVWSHAFALGTVIDRRKSMSTKLRDFETQGDVSIYEDRTWFDKDIVDYVRRVKDSGLLYQVGIDPAGAGTLISDFEKIEVTVENNLLSGIRQGFWLTDAIKVAERKLVTDQLWHDGSNMMKWCVSNLKIELLATGLRVTKHSAGDQKIDPVIAMFNAVKIMCGNPVIAKAGTAEQYFKSFGDTM